MEAKKFDEDEIVSREYHEEQMMILHCEIEQFEENEEAYKATIERLKKSLREQCAEDHRLGLENDKLVLENAELKKKLRELQKGASVNNEQRSKEKIQEENRNVEN